MKKQIFSPIFEPWHANLTDKQIKDCQGDYFGCEICRNKSRCANIKLEQFKTELNRIEAKRK